MVLLLLPLLLLKNSLLVPCAGNAFSFADSLQTRFAGYVLFKTVLASSPSLPHPLFFKKKKIPLCALGDSAQGYAPIVNTVGAGMPATRAVVDCWHGHLHTTPAANIPRCTARLPYCWKRSRWPGTVWICTIERGHNWPLTPVTSIIYLFLQPLFPYCIWKYIVSCRETRMLHLSEERCPTKLTRKRQDSADTTRSLLHTIPVGRGCQCHKTGGCRCTCGTDCCWQQPY